MAKVIVAIRPTSSKGASSVTRYIAESKRNPEKENLKDKEARPLFSKELDGLTHQQADELLGQGQGWFPETDEVIHLVISPEEGSFEELGPTTEKQIENFKDIVREAADVIEKEVGFEELRWVAGIHLNTDIPHAHMAISRYGLHQETDKYTRIDHLPKTLLPHNEKTPDGEKEFQPGLIAETVSNGIELNRAAVRTPAHEQETAPTIEPAATPEISAAEPPVTSTAIETVDAVPAETETTDYSAAAADHDNQPEPEPFDFSTVDQFAPDTEIDGHSDQPLTTTVHEEHAPARTLDSHEKTTRDRETIGQSMIARGEVERLEAELDSLVNHGDKRRFRVYDATHDRTRQLSEFDIHRRADARASVIVKEKEITDPDKRHHARQVQYETEVHDHEKGIRDHQIIVSKMIRATAHDLDLATVKHSNLKAEVRTIQNHYRSAGMQLPVPIIDPPFLAKLQDQAIANQNVSRTAVLENIRVSLANEFDRPTRTDTEIARLEGQLLVSRAEQAARHQRAYQFEKHNHQTRWEVADEKYSLLDIDRRIALNESRSRIFGTDFKTINLLPSHRHAAAQEAARLKEVRVVVVDKIEERKTELATSLKQSTKLTQNLSEILVREQQSQRDRHEREGQGERLPKILTRGEISHLIDHAATLGDRSMLQQAYILEARYHENQTEAKRPSIQDQAARAAGREVISQIAVKQAQERLKAFEERRDFVPVLVKDLNGQEVTSRLFDVREPRHPVKWLIHRLAENKAEKHLRVETHKGVEAEHQQLQQDLANARDCGQLTTAVTDTFRNHFQAENQPMPEPTFTTRQVVQLEIYALKQPDLTERDRIGALINNAELSHHVFTPVALDQEPANLDPTAPDINGPESALSAPGANAAPSLSPTSPATQSVNTPDAGVTQTPDVDVDVFL
jgi:hypothetical protein